MASEENTKRIYSEMRAYPFFTDFPDDLVFEFARLAENIKMPVGDYLLRRGKANHSLYFLRSGKVNVLIDGEIVSTLFQTGEVIGEMSLIKRQAASADVRVIEVAELFRVTEPEFTKKSGPEQQKARQLLDRVYANVLVERLTLTSEKAKRFETANRELQAAQQELRKLNANLESEILRRTSEIVQKVKALTLSHLRPAQNQISAWLSGLSNEKKLPEIKEFSNLRVSLNEVVESLQPVIELSELGSNKESIQSKSVLLLALDKKLQMITKMALGGTGIRLISVSEAKDFPTDSPNLVLVDQGAEELFKNFMLRFPQLPVVFMLNNDMPLYLECLSKFSELPIFITHDLNQRAFSLRGISTAVAKTLIGAIFGMEKYLSWGTHIEEKPVIYSDQRLDLINEMKSYFKNLGVRGSILDRAHTVAEELLMNAIYDAPQNPDGSAIYNHLDRSEKIVLQKEHQGKFRYGTDGSVLTISVADPFGALSKDIVHKYLASCYSGQAGIYNQKKGGAGRGLHMMIETADLTVFNVKKGIQTEIISLFYSDQVTQEEWKPTCHLFFL